MAIFWGDVGENIQIGIRTVGEFDYEVVGMEAVEEVQEQLPRAPLDRLSAVVAEAEMHGLFHLDGIEDAVDGRLGDRRTLGASRVVDLLPGVHKAHGHVASPLGWERGRAPSVLGGIICIKAGPRSKD